MIPAKVSRTQNKLGLQHLLDWSREPVRYLSLLLKLTVIFFSMESYTCFIFGSFNYSCGVRALDLHSLNRSKIIS